MNDILNVNHNVSTLASTQVSTTTNEQKSLEAVAQAFEKMVLDQAFAFTPIAKGNLSNLGYAQKNSVVNDLFKEELHNQSEGMLMDTFIKQMQTSL